MNVFEGRHLEHVRGIRLCFHLPSNMVPEKIHLN
jgi:hypothetical protein